MKEIFVAPVTFVVNTFLTGPQTSIQPDLN